MAARDLFHDAVRNALIKDGWAITHDPMRIQVGGVEMLIDLGAEKLIGAEKNGDKIAVEIKSFVRPSAISEFHTAVGQYRNYYLALRSDQPERALYLAVPEDAYDKFFRLAFVQEAIQFNNVSLLIYDAQQEVIVKWLK